ncbi:MAG: hypothetical protein ACXV5H_00595 [Halobacteriota archaeon]
MKLKRFHISFKNIVSEAKSELKSYVLGLSADRGYHIDDLMLFFDDTGFLPGVRVSLRPTLNYDERELSDLETALETDLNNIVFRHVYNSRHKINSEDSSRVMCIPHIGECLPQLVVGSQN